MKVVTETPPVITSNATDWWNYTRETLFVSSACFPFLTLLCVLQICAMAWIWTHPSVDGNQVSHSRRKTRTEAQREAEEQRFIRRVQAMGDVDEDLIQPEDEAEEPLGYVVENDRLYVNSVRRRTRKNE